MAKCYDSYGNLAVGNDVPCSQNGTPAQCCWAIDSCASNGLCITNAKRLTPYFINSCTVQAWAQALVPTCLTQCLNSGGNGVQPCGGDRYCCYGLSGCDCNNSAVFTLPPIKFAAPPPSNTTSVSSSTASSTSPSPTLVSATSSATASQISQSSETTSSINANNNNLGIGVGVGLGVGVPLILAVMDRFWFLSKKRKNEGGYAYGYHAPEMAYTPSQGVHASQKEPQIIEAPQELLADHVVHQLA